ncbi:MAG: hypothetical protein QM486_03255 [Flavobacteriaceae bacterium]
MKIVTLFMLSLGFISCNQSSNSNTQKLQNRINSLEKQIAQSYKPGFGELMGNIQTHHAKLWFAGTNKNWKLADFEIHELIENVENITLFNSDRKESALVDMINPDLDSLKMSIKNKDIKAFKSHYITMTNTCNKCHSLTHFDFNIVTVPKVSSFSNQEFSINKKTYICK